MVSPQRSVRVLLYLAFLTAVSLFGFLRPLRTFDRLLYAATVASLRYSDPSVVHEIARREFDKEPDPYISQPQNTEYTNAVLENPQVLYNHVWLFKIKAGYVWLGYAIWRMGLPILVGLRLISAVSLFVLGVLVLMWTRDELASALLILIPPVLNTGRMVTADPLSTVAILGALLCWSRGRINAALLLTLVSISIRTDNVVFGILFICVLLIARSLSIGKSLAAGAVLVATAFWINHVSGYYGWSAVMYHSFVHPILDPIHHLQRITATEYIKALRTCALQVVYSPTPVFVFMWLIVWRKAMGKIRLMLALAAVWSIVRLLMFPNPDDRFFVWAYLLVGITMLATVYRDPTPVSKSSDMDAISSHEQRALASSRA